MPTKRNYAKLDAMTPEQVRAFKSAAAGAAEITTAARRLDRPAKPERLIVAHGDSWFDYPIGTDIVDCLRKFHGYRVINHAQAGDTLENLVYGTRFNPTQGYRALPSRFEDVLDDLRRHKAKVLLFSGGGNDVAGEEFAQFLEHADANLGPFRRAHAEHVICVFFRRVLSDMIRRASDASPGVQIFTHGYGYPKPDGRGIGLAIGLSFIGPWLRPALAAKRIDPATDGVAIVGELIDMFNDMLAVVSQEHANVHHLDLRPVIGKGARAWINELHVRNSVYASIADLFDQRMREAGAWDGSAGARASRPRRAGARRRSR
jgi:hypothetical protein